MDNFSWPPLVISSKNFDFPMIHPTKMTIKRAPNGSRILEETKSKLSKIDLPPMVRLVLLFRLKEANTPTAMQATAAITVAQRLLM